MKGIRQIGIEFQGLKGRKAPLAPIRNWGEINHRGHREHRGGEGEIATKERKEHKGGEAHQGAQLGIFESFVHFVANHSSSYGGPASRRGRHECPSSFIQSRPSC